ncbi:hypothetical protein KI387_024492, partial [Taxus chinensis]
SQPQLSPSPRLPDLSSGRRNTGGCDGTGLTGCSGMGYLTDLVEWPDLHDREPDALDPDCHGSATRCSGGTTL